MRRITLLLLSIIIFSQVASVLLAQNRVTARFEDLKSEAAPATIERQASLQKLPVVYEEHRFYVRPVTKDGVTMRLFTDTGGGLFILREAAERLRLSINNVGPDGEDGFYLATLPKFRAEASIPPPLSREGRIPVWSPSEKEREGGLMMFDGMLGQEWFAGRTWVFDYPGKSLYLRLSPVATERESGRRITLGFKSDESGRRQLNFPRFEVEIDGEKLDMLFDTGATTRLSKQALDALRDGGAAERATSFIATEVFDRWRARHPDWRVIESADLPLNEPMIEVPRVTIASYAVGPVWFTRRANKNFHEFMSQFMDKRVEGAIGGAALRHFRITVDYPNATAVFSK